MEMTLQTTTQPSAPPASFGPPPASFGPPPASFGPSNPPISPPPNYEPAFPPPYESIAEIDDRGPPLPSAAEVPRRETVYPIPAPLTQSFVEREDDDDDFTDDDIDETPVRFREARRTTRPDAFDERLSRDLANAVTERAQRSRSTSALDLQSDQDNNPSPGRAASSRRPQNDASSSSTLLTMKRLVVALLVLVVVVAVVLSIVLNVEPTRTRFAEGLARYFMLPVITIIEYYQRLSGGGIGGLNDTMSTNSTNNTTASTPL